MSHVNIHIPRSADIFNERAELLQRTEMEFWRKKAEILQEELHNLFAHAKAHGGVELYRGGETLILTVFPVASAEQK